MKKFLEPFNDRTKASNPGNGTTRIQKASDGSIHLHVFYNGSWRHDQKCKIKTNKDCTMEAK